MPEARGKLYVLDMLRYAREVAQFTDGTTIEDFHDNIEKQYAIVRAIELIGEAAKGVPEDLRTISSNIPWRQITGMRDKLIHHYFAVRLESVWSVATRDIPMLIGELENLVAIISTKGDLS